MFLSEWRQFPSVPCLAGKETWWQLASRCCWNRARPWRASGLVSGRAKLSQERSRVLTLLFSEKTHTGGAGKSLARSGKKQANISVRMASISFGALPCRKRNLMAACVSVLLKSRASLTCFRACFFSGRAKDLLEPGYVHPSHCNAHTAASRRILRVRHTNLARCYKQIVFTNVTQVFLEEI